MAEQPFINSFQQFQRSYEIAPIWLEGGIAQNLPNKIMSILKLTEGDDRATYPDANDYFAHFKVLSGGTLQEWMVADYPFASMAMAANAVVQNPLKISMMMVCPAQASPQSNNYRNSYIAKSATLTTLKFSIDDHIAGGGTFVVNTPSFVYTNAILTSLKDISITSDKQVQYMWQWDFICPLITQSQTESVYNSLYEKMSQGLPVQSVDGEVPQSGVSSQTNIADTQTPTGSL